jgi:23S rRNA (guanosine2251-2'-O)-methyltransferase
VRCKPRDKASLTRLAGSPDHQGVVAACQPYPYVDAEEILAAPGPVIVLDAVQDVHNLGAVARVAETLGAAGLVIAAKGSPGVTPAVCKTSAGAVEHLRIARVDSMVAFVHDARRNGRRAIGSDSESGVDYRTSGLDHRSILVLGSEGEGIRPRLRSVCDEIVAIPMVGKVASLNLSVASAILLARAVLRA